LRILNNKNIYLLGFMGAGKTTVGKLLSKKINYSFVDLDSKIESNQNCKITEIFKKTTPLKIALKFTEVIRAHPLGLSIMPGARHWDIFTRLCRKLDAAGNKMPDIYLAALAIESETQFITAVNGFKNINGLDCLILKP